MNCLGLEFWSFYSGFGVYIISPNHDFTLIFLPADPFKKAF